MSPASSEMFDIFSGVDDRDAVWIESAVGIDDAEKRMQEIAAEKPGDYFVFHVPSHSVLSRVSATALAAEAEKTLDRKKARAS
jgi:hypothetical protein